jgi:hypothetical protein
LIVIPDDAAELDNEAAALRREWRRGARINRWRQRLGLAPVRIGAGRTSTSLALPLLIMSIAIVATLTSLFALVWPNHPVRRTTSSEPSAAASAATLADITLLDDSFKPVRLRDVLPAVILLVDGCDCAGLISATATAAPAAVSVLVVAHAAPSLPRASAIPTPPSDSTGPSAAVPAARIRALADPAGVLLTAFRPGSSPRGEATAVLVRRGGQILRPVALTGVDQIRPDLARLP